MPDILVGTWKSDGDTLILREDGYLYWRHVGVFVNWGGFNERQKYGWKVNFIYGDPALEKFLTKKISLKQKEKLIEEIRFI